VNVARAAADAVEYMRTLGLELESRRAADDTIELRWKGPGPVVAWVLARFGLTGSVPPASDGGKTSVGVSARATDLRRLARAFGELRERGYIAEGALAFTATDGWDRIESARGPRARAVFWNWQAHADAFDDDGDLIDDLHLQWAGNKDEIAAALRSQGFEVHVPETSGDTFIVTANRGTPSPAHPDEALMAVIATGLGDGWSDDVRGGQRWRRWEREGVVVLVSALEGDVVVVREVGSESATLYATPTSENDIVTAIAAHLDAMAADGLEALASSLRADGVDVTLR